MHLVLIYTVSMAAISFTSAVQYASDQLTGLYPADECRQFVKLFFENKLNYRSSDFILRRDDPMPEETEKDFFRLTERLLTGEPVQYIIGNCWFRGLQYHVEPGVLIPRPETEELVEWIISSIDRPDCSILDIGTGSGCIAVSLKHEVRGSVVEAWDISEKALWVASENAKNNQCDIILRQVDILNDKPDLNPRFDIIVSNPPYIRMSEKEQMHVNVLHHEPHLALFVDDQDPLVFYRAIAIAAKSMLKAGGWLYFEINELFGVEVTQLLIHEGYKSVKVKADLNGKTRMVRGKLNCR